MRRSLKRTSAVTALFAGGLLFASTVAAPAADALTARKQFGTEVLPYDSLPNGSGPYVIESALKTNMVVDVGGGSLASGGNIQLYTSNGTGAQKFYVDRKHWSGYGYVFSVRNAASGKYMDVQGAGSRDGTNVWQYDWNGSAAQLWILHVGTHGCRAGMSPVIFENYAHSTNDTAGLVLDVGGAGTANGTNIQGYSWNGTNAQRFCLRRA